MFKKPLKICSWDKHIQRIVGTMYLIGVSFGDSGRGSCFAQQNRCLTQTPNWTSVFYFIVVPNGRKSVDLCDRYLRQYRNHGFGSFDITQTPPVVPCAPTTIKVASRSNDTLLLLFAEKEELNSCIHARMIKRPRRVS